jgi:hypothetical protein
MLTTIAKVVATLQKNVWMNTDNILACLKKICEASSIPFD